jgi:endonuclease/exonuclease/phosphatase family metal-dependent hydrolase
VTLKLLSYNIRYGGAGREERLAEVIREASPDVVMFQEGTNPQVIERLARATGMGTWASRLGYSTAFISRLEIAKHEWHRPPGGRHPFLEVVPAGIDVSIFGLHLSAVHSAWTERRRVRELRSLLKLVAQREGGFHVVTGDFNTLAPGELLDTRRLPHRLRALVWLSGGRIRWETIQMMLDGGYVDAYRMLHPEDRGYTFPTWDPHVRLDYVFTPAAFAERLASCEVVANGASDASDHFPLLARIEAG